MRTPDRNSKHANGNEISDGNGKVATPLSPRSTRQSGWQCTTIKSKSTRSLKVLVISLVTYAISIQFKSAYRTLESPAESKYSQQVEYEPPGARRWEDGKIDRNNNLRSNSEDDSSDNGAPLEVPRSEQQLSPSSRIPPQGARRWESGGNEDRNLFNNKKIRGENDTDNAHQQQQNEDKHDIHQEAPTPEQLSPSRRIPRSVSLENSIDLFSVTAINAATISLKFKKDSMPRDGPSITSSWYEPNADEFIDGYDWNMCEPMAEWQLTSYPNCNSFHELDMPHMRMINKGGSRIAFEMIQHLDGEEHKFVYKTIKYLKDVTAKLVEEQRKDSIVLERTSSSEFIPDIHGYCSLGVMMDFMPEGNMHDYIKGARLVGGSTLPPVDRLRLSM